MIFTFYSFKGGVGRSMALANIAELFYARGLKVLMVDFDLEAPGLERYFDVPNSATSRSEIVGHRGVIDAILSFRELRTFAPKMPPSAAPENDSLSTFPFSVEPISNFIVAIYDIPNHPGKLALMPSGNRAKPDFAAYAKRVLELDWGKFYTQEDGESFFEWFRQELNLDWDVVLIDSRTGVTELGGVCTHHLADGVVSFVATNLQNLEGTAMMARSLGNPDLVDKGRKGRGLQQMFVPSRVELSEEDKHDVFAARFNDELGKFFPAHHTPERSWFLDLRLLYVAAYSYLERVAVREPERASKADLIQAYGRLATHMAAITGSGTLFEAYSPTVRTLSNLPARKPYFSGREEELKRIRANLSTGTPVAVCGLAGIGKTGLVLEYAYRYRSEYSYALFLRATSEDLLLQGCDEISRMLQLGTKLQSRDALRAWLTETDGWLLIVDDANEPALLSGLVPPSVRGHVLYTTRTQQVSGLAAQPIPLETLPSAAAINFFQSRLGRAELTESERQAAVQLVDEVGALPLALEQAAAYIANRNSRIQDYLASYRRRRLGLLNQESALIAGRQVSVAAVLEPALDEMERTPASADVLRVAAFLAPEPIPISFLVQGAEHLGKSIASALSGSADDPLALDEILDPLAKFSLIERQPTAPTFSVHKLVSDMVRSRVSESGLWGKRVRAALIDTFPEPTWESVAICADLIPHVMAVLSSWDDTRLRIKAARYLLLRGDSPKAAECLLAKMPTEPSVDTAVAIDLLAQAYFAQSRYKEATELLRHALQLQGEWELGDSVRLRLSLDLAGVCAESGQINEANKLYERVAKDSAGSDLEITVLALSGQARAICRSNPEEGLKAARRAVTYAERLGSPFALATAQGVLANTLIIAGHALEPETTEVLTRAISGSEQTYGPEHPALAQLLQMYALLLHANGKQSEAQAIYRRGQTILDKVFGPDSLTAVQYRTEYEQMMALAIGPK